uniref:HAT C-terminal dimerisation domain-containing protein n=1 Tax=Lactuca sativa TaxID=4236 RepID=A0A9R1WQM5_LACSA|nr:hypothetical protein LSAT_V11C900485360 [Lactuca sativa]
MVILYQHNNLEVQMQVLILHLQQILLRKWMKGKRMKRESKNRKLLKHRLILLAIMMIMITQFVRIVVDDFIVLGIDKVFMVTVDNASSNDLCIRYLKRRLNAWKHSVLDSQHLHMRCCAHILSLVVKEGLKDVNTSISRIRSAVKYVRSSPATLQRFKGCVEKIKIERKSLVCFHVETWWNSTYLMLESAIKFQDAFDLLEKQDGKYRSELLSLKGFPKEEDWKHVRFGVTNENPTTSSGHFEEEILIDVDDDPTTFLNNQYKRLLEEKSSGTAAKCELDWYLSEQCESFDNKFNLFSWWKKNQARFLIIAAIARDVLAIPASNVASESSFSTGGRILDAFCSSLTPTTVEALICSQNWLRSKNVPIDIDESFEAPSNYEAEVKDLPQTISALTMDD